MTNLVLETLAALVLLLAFFSFLVARVITYRFPAPGKFLRLGSERVHYTDEGAGPALVFIHGLYGSGQNFTYALTNELVSKHRIVVIDRPGSGYSTRAYRGSARLFKQAEVLAEVIKVLKLERPLVIGHSLGGAVSLALATKHSELVSGLVLVAPLTQLEETPPDIFKGLWIHSRLRRLLTAWTLAVPMSILRGQTIGRTIFSPEPVPRDFDFKGGGILSLRSSSFFSASTDVMELNEDLEALIEIYPSIKCPIGVIYGDQDRILASEKHGSGFAKQNPKAHLRILKSRGHMLPVTAPGEVAAFIEEIENEALANG